MRKNTKEENNLKLFKEKLEELKKIKITEDIDREIGNIEYYLNQEINKYENEIFKNPSLNEIKIFFDDKLTDISNIKIENGLTIITRDHDKIKFDKEIKQITLNFDMQMVGIIYHLNDRKEKCSEIKMIFNNKNKILDKVSKLIRKKKY